MSGDENFPLASVTQTNGVMLIMSFLVNGFPVTVSSVNVSSGISRIMDDSENSAVCQGSP